MKFFEYIRQRRELLGLTQKDIAEALSVDVPMYSRYERGLRRLKEAHIPILASILNMDYECVRKLWVADKVLSVVNKEKNATDILYIVADRLTENNEPKYES